MAYQRNSTGVDRMLGMAEAKFKRTNTASVIVVFNKLSIKFCQLSKAATS